MESIEIDIKMCMICGGGGGKETEERGAERKKKKGKQAQGDAHSSSQGAACLNSAPPLVASPS